MLAASVTLATLASVSAVVASPAGAAPAQAVSVTPVLPSTDLVASIYAPLGVANTVDASAFVRNAGAGASGVVAEIEVSSGLVIEAATIGWFALPCTVTSSSARCSLGSLAAGAEKFVSLRIRKVTPGDQVITMSAVADQADDTPADNVATGTVEVLRPDLGVALEVDEDIRTGESFGVVASVVHQGVPSSDVVVRFTVSPGLALDSAAIGWFAVPCATEGATATCPLGTMVGTSRFVVLRLRATEPGAPTVTATVGNGVADRNPANDVDVVTVPVDGIDVLDLTIVSYSSAGVVGPGTPFFHQLQVTNSDPERSATDVVVTSAAPAGFVVTGASVLGGACTIDGRDVRCTVDELGPGYTTPATIWLIAASVEGSYDLVGTVSSSVADPAPLDNTASRTVIVGPPDLSTRILEWPSQVELGSTFTSRVDVANHGAHDPAAVLRIDVPAGLTVESAAIGWLSRPCTIAGSTVTCAIGSLGNTLNFVLVRFTATAPGDHTVTAIANDGRPDLDPSDNSTSATVTVSG